MFHSAMTKKKKIKKPTKPKPLMPKFRLYCIAIQNTFKTNESLTYSKGIEAFQSIMESNYVGCDVHESGG